MLRKSRGTAIAAAVVAAALALAGAAVAALTTGTQATKATVKVTEREYRISMPKTALPSGTVQFSVHNAGHLAHGLALSGGGLAGIKKIARIAPGTTRTLTVVLKGGTLHVWCPVAGHAALGMKTTARVRGAVTTGGSTTGTVTYSTTTDVWG